MAEGESRHFIACPKCSARFAVAEAMAGRRARCKACNQAFRVPRFGANEHHEATSEPVSPPSSSTIEKPRLVSVECRVCGTLMYGRLEHVGKKVKCPDCGAGTVLPQPPPPKQPNIPAAMLGEQYELWEEDEQPLPSEMIASEPKYIGISCSICGTLMYAPEDRVGEEVECPDCSARHVVPQVLRPVVRPSVLTPDSQTPELDPTSFPGARPAIVRPVVQLSIAEQREQETYERALEKSRRTGKPMELDPRGRPVLPRWPLVTGTVSFLFSSGVPSRWFGLGVAYFASIYVFAYGLSMAYSGGMGALAGMCFFTLGCVLIMLCSAYCSTCLIQIVTESSEGNREIQYWPPLLDWFGGLVYFIVGTMLSALPGWAIGHIPPISTKPGLGELLTAVSIWFCFPIVLLSQLDINSPWGVLSARVLKSLFKCPFSWLLFYAEWALIAFVCAWPVINPDGLGHFGRFSQFAFFLLVPLNVIGLFLFARLLGRLGWRLAERMPLDEPEEEERPRGPKNYNPPRGKAVAR